MQDRPSTREQPLSARPAGHWRRLFCLMLSARIAGNALRVSLVVGTLLNLINQGEYLLAGEGIMVGHMLLNYMVPYGVASYSGARAVPRDSTTTGCDPPPAG